jgi:hypothetical protein
MGHITWARGNLIVRKIEYDGQYYKIADLEGSDLGDAPRLWEPELLEADNYHFIIRGFEGEPRKWQVQEWECEAIPANDAT